MITLKQLYHYPIKGFSAQELDEIELSKGKPFPLDRIFALTRQGGGMDPDFPVWAKKSKFVMLMFDEALASIATHYFCVSGVLKIWKDDQIVLETNLLEPKGRLEFERFVCHLLDFDRADFPPKLFSASPMGPTHFMDKPDAVISMINLATVRAVAEEWGVEIDPMRFRANIYVDGLEPWAEFDLIGKCLTNSDVVMNVDRRNSRCAATNVNPTTAKRDLSIPLTLKRTYGHTDLGVYLKVETGGFLRRDDVLSIT